ncbi:MAG: polyphosphate:AMP phosphotransferase [Clostridiales bacterium]|jgi:polyphosphate:AMP phosphotransferase|nr:polyphosphate:AMP phosphotransferase [Clostridiales bacterium]
MLDKMDLNQTLDKQTYRQEMKSLEKRLASLQETIQALEIPVIIAFEGWSAAGKGTHIGKLLHPLDPRYFNVYTMDKVTEDAAMRPFLWSYWIKTPSKGRVAIFDKSWNRMALPGASSKWKLSAAERDGFYYDVNAFERQLRDDGTLIIKFFLHISQEEQKARFKELEKSSDTAWRVNEHDWEQNKNYEAHLQQFMKMIHETSSSDCTWSIIEATDKKYAEVKIIQTIIGKEEEEILKRAERRHESPKEKLQAEVSILSTVDLTMTLEEKEYKDKLDTLQTKISSLGYKLYTKKRAVVIVYEGWDASGKGGNIKRLTEQLDPRAFEVVPIGAPSAEELNHHYLWRFYNKLPKDGHIAIFDRSWYGRVMVERVENLAAEEAWRRAYKEINDMERHLSNHGTILFKFWLHIDQNEQLARFESRQKDPFKQYKITDEDWRNREKWDQYVSAVDEMLFRTNTSYAPWTIVESNCKKYARIKTLEIVVSELERQLK